MGNSTRSEHPHQQSRHGTVGYTGGVTADELADPQAAQQSGAGVSDSFTAEDESYQTSWADLEVGEDVGGDGTNPKFISPFMGNLLGADLTKEGAYLAGVIAALSITGARATEYQIGALIGILMDGVTDADGIVVAVVDGSDPSSETHANAAFAARMNNADPASGVDYGLDLHDPGRGDLFSGDAEPLHIHKALLRSPSEVCILEGSGAAVDGGSGTGAGFAGPGSLYIRTSNGTLFQNTGTKASPTWTAR